MKTTSRILLYLCSAAVAAGQTSPPAWWTNVIRTDTPNIVGGNTSAANVGQAKHVVMNALTALDSVSIVLGDSVRERLAEGGNDVSLWTAPTTQAEIDAQKAPLLAGQLKALASPFYDVLAETAGPWLDKGGSTPGQLQLNETKHSAKPLNYYPWGEVWPNFSNPESFKNPVAIGQLKAVFSLRFDTLGAHSPFAPANGIGRVASALNDSVDRRLIGKTGGESQMAVFSSYDHSAGTYTRNTNLWCSDVVSELTGVAAFKGGPGASTGVWDSYGGVMITKRHILFCAHAHPAYPGSSTWVNGLGNNIRFVTAGNVVVQRNLVWGAQVGTNDLWLGLLDQDVPASVNVYRLFPAIAGLGPYGTGTVSAVEIGFSQGTGRVNPQTSYNEENSLCSSCSSSNYGSVVMDGGVGYYQQVPMVYVSNLGGSDCNLSLGPVLRQNFKYCVWGGDSGTPRFHVFGNELLLSRIVLSGGGGGVTVGDKVATLNSTISSVDSGAVTAGVTTAPTGYSVEPATGAELGLFTPTP